MRSDILKFALLAAFISLRPSPAVGFGENATMRMIQMQTQFIRHTATEYQRRVAEQNAKAFFKQLTPAKKAELKKKNVKTVLIRTVRSQQTSKNAKDVRMRVSLDGESLIDNDVYEFNTSLEPGTITKVQGLDPEYVSM